MKKAVLKLFIWFFVLVGFSTLIIQLNDLAYDDIYSVNGHVAFIYVLLGYVVSSVGQVITEFKKE